MVMQNQRRLAKAICVPMYQFQNIQIRRSCFLVVNGLNGCLLTKRHLKDFLKSTGIRVNLPNPLSFPVVQTLYQFMSVTAGLGKENFNQS